MIGAATLVPLSEALHAELGHLVPGVQGIVYGIAIILVILLAPGGIYWRVRDLLRGRAPASPPSAVTAPAPVVPVAAGPAAARPPSAKPILEVRGISKIYGGLRPSRTCRSTWRKARSSASSARTAPARPLCLTC